MEKSTLTKDHPVLLSEEHIYSLDDYEINENKEESFPARNGESKQKKRTKISKETSKILYNWIVSHNEYPYPSSEDLEELTALTKLNEKQIRIWFTNYRNRKLEPTTSCLSKIKYTLLHKNIKDLKTSESKSKVINDAANEYLHRYFCCCDAFEITPKQKKQKENMNERAVKFLLNNFKIFYY